MRCSGSERKRTIGIILFISFFAVLTFIRIFILGSAMSRWGFFVLAILVAFEFGFLLVVNHALNSDGDIPREVLYLVLALESLCPAVGVAFATSSRLLPDYHAPGTGLFSTHPAVRSAVTTETVLVFRSSILNRIFRGCLLGPMAFRCWCRWFHSHADSGSLFCPCPAGDRDFSWRYRQRSPNPCRSCPS